MQKHGRSDKFAGIDDHRCKNTLERTYAQKKARAVTGVLKSMRFNDAHMASDMEQAEPANTFKATQMVKPLNLLMWP